MQLLADFILVSGFAINLVLLIMLALSKNRELPQNILMAILGVILLIIITLYAFLHGIRPLFLVTNLLEDGARFIIGPLIYIYVKSIFIKDEDFIKKHLIHFLPFLIFWCFFTVPMVLGNYLESNIFEYVGLAYGSGYMTIPKDLFVLAYIILSIRLFFRFKRAMKSNYSSMTNANFGWLQKFLIGMLLTTLFDLFLIVPHVLNGSSLSLNRGIISVMFLVLITFYLGYHGLKQSMVYLPEFLTNESKPRQPEKSATQFLSKEELSNLKDRLDAILKTEKPYLEQELTLNGLAELLDTTDKKLSVLLNHSLNISFYDFINSYRIEEFKEKCKLEEYKKYTLLGIAYTCGFNSKSSFYRAFKKETGISPTDYKKQSFS